MLRVVVAVRERVRLSWASFACAAWVATCASALHAQGPTGEAPPPPPPPPLTAPPPPLTTPPPPPADATACVPACRDGYTCVEGKCVEACNPPCAAGSHCTGAGECLPDAPPPPPPSYTTTPPAYPEAPPEETVFEGPDPGAERHDGFMFRVALGFGGGVASDKAGSREFVYSSPGASFSFDIGGAPLENLVIHGRLADFVIVNPSVSIDGMDTGTAEDVSLDALLIGPALTYYFMPINLYLTGAIGLSYLSMDDGTDTSSSDVGFGLNFDVGWEWWVSANWGLGVAGRFWFTGLTDKSGSVSEDWSFLASGLLFSATYQ